LKVHVEKEFSDYKEGINDKIAKLDADFAKKLGGSGSGNLDETLEIKKAQKENLEKDLEIFELKNEILKMKKEQNEAAAA